VRDAIHTFNERGLGALVAGSSRPKRTRATFDEHGAEAVKELLHRSPREFGRDSSLWTLEMAAQVAFEEGLTRKQVSPGDHPGNAFAPAGSEVAQSQTLDHFT
jgi:hypothetical protein